MADDRLRLNAGFIYAAILNTAPWADPNREPAQPSDIVPSMQQAKEELDLRTLTPEQQKMYIFRVFQGAGKRSMR